MRCSLRHCCPGSGSSCLSAGRIIRRSDHARHLATASGVRGQLEHSIKCSKCGIRTACCDWTAWWTGQDGLARVSHRRHARARDMGRHGRLAKINRSHGRRRCDRDGRRDGGWGSWRRLRCWCSLLAREEAHRCSCLYARLAVLAGAAICGVCRSFWVSSGTQHNAESRRLERGESSTTVGRGVGSRLRRRRWGHAADTFSRSSNGEAGADVEDSAPEAQEQLAAG